MRYIIVDRDGNPRALLDKGVDEMIPKELEQVADVVCPHRKPTFPTLQVSRCKKAATVDIFIPIDFEMIVEVDGDKGVSNCVTFHVIDMQAMDIPLMVFSGAFNFQPSCFN